jgi:hypothetical protein
LRFYALGYIVAKPHKKENGKNALSFYKQNQEALRRLVGFLHGGIFCGVFYFAAHRRLYNFCLYIFGLQYACICYICGNHQAL